MRAAVAVLAMISGKLYFFIEALFVICMNKVKRAIVTPDKHFPFEDKKAIKVLCKAIELVKPDIYIDLGDTGEWESVSHWQWKKKKRPPLEYQLPFVHKEIKAVNKGMDIIDRSLDKAGTKERHFCEGNHEDWLNRFVEENPYLAKEMLVEHALKLKERGYKYHRIGKMLKIGKIHFYHGQELIILAIILLGSVVMLCTVIIMTSSKALLRTLMG